MDSLPADLRKALTAKTKTQWDALTEIARRDFISWINDAKQAETRASRIKRVPSMLASGKRRPCCFAVVPMHFYKALGTNPKAKAQWTTLTAMEKRDFTDWVDQDKELRDKRVEEACAKLVAKKRNP